MRGDSALGRTRSARIRMCLPTALSGISFLGRGRLWYRPVRSKEYEDGAVLHPSRSAARAAALAAMDKRAGAVTSRLLPEQIFAGQQDVVMALAPWQVTQYQDVEYRGHLTLTLPRRDQTRSQEFSAARRIAQLDMITGEEAATFLGDGPLSDLTTARRWWLTQYLQQAGTDRSWDVFDEHIRPLVVAAQRSEDDIDRLARVLVTATDRISQKPQHKTLLFEVLQHTFTFMGWPELAADIGAVGLQAREDPSSTGQGTTTP